jgi:hypothetical protein
LEVAYSANCLSCSTHVLNQTLPGSWISQRLSDIFLVESHGRRTAGFWNRAVVYSTSSFSFAKQRWSSFDYYRNVGERSLTSGYCKSSTLVNNAKFVHCRTGTAARRMQCMKCTGYNIQNMQVLKHARHPRKDTWRCWRVIAKACVVARAGAVPMSSNCHLCLAKMREMGPSCGDSS